jgi:AcrR family transcriptional regulator
MSVQDRKLREFQRREDELLRAALALSNRDDWQSVTIEEVAQKTEIGKGTVYKHFRSKDEIYARLAVEFHRIVLARVRAVDAALPPLERLRGIIRAFWDVYRTHGEYQRVVEYCQRPDFKRSLGDEARRGLQDVEDGFAATLDETLRAAVDAGVLPARPRQLALFGAQAALFGALRLLWLDCLPGPNEHYLDELIEFILAGLTRGRPGRRKAAN